MLARSGVYQIVNKINARRYIGSAISLNSRRRRHFLHLRRGIHHNQYLQRAYDKYGRDAFTFSVILYVPPQDCMKVEQWFLDDWNPEYNMCTDARSKLGLHHSKETKSKISASTKGRVHSPESIEKNRQSHLGTSWGHHTEESKQRISESNKLAKNVGPHTRWHANRGMVSPSCEFCRGGV